MQIDGYDLHIGKLQEIIKENKSFKYKVKKQTGIIN